MIALQPTDFERGRRHPSELIAPRPTAKGKKGVSKAERERRAALVRDAIEQLGEGPAALAKHLGVRTCQVSTWIYDKKVVPAKHLPALNALTGSNGSES